MIAKDCYSQSDLFVEKTKLKRVFSIRNIWLKNTQIKIQISTANKYILKILHLHTYAYNYIQIKILKDIKYRMKICVRSNIHLDLTNYKFYRDLCLRFLS